MSAVIETSKYFEIAEQLPPDAVATFHDVEWSDYEELLDQVGEAVGMRISYGDGVLTIMTTSDPHEVYAEFIDRMVSLLSVRFRINIRFFGRATMKLRKLRKGLEPDACFYVQSADALGKRIERDLEQDPPPDVAVEIDVHHDSRPKLSIYAALGVPELWRFDGTALSINLLKEGGYVEAEQGVALPLLTAGVLTDFLNRLRDQGELDAILAFDEWLKTQSL